MLSPDESTNLQPGGEGNDFFCTCRKVQLPWTPSPRRTQATPSSRKHGSVHALRCHGRHITPIDSLGAVRHSLPDLPLPLPLLDALP